MASNGDRPSTNGDKNADHSNQQSHQLRRPGASMNAVDEITTLASNLSVNNASSSSGLSNGLNPYASEFVPSFAMKPTPPVFYPPSQPAQPVSRHTNGSSQVWGHSNDGMNGDGYNDADCEIDDYFALNELKEFIDQVSSTPGAYDNYIQNVTEVLNNCIDEDEDVILQCIVNLIVDQAITDQNFRYNGMRLCEHLIGNLTLRGAKGTFKDELLKRCQREHLRRETLTRSADSGNYLRGVTLFVADLSTRLPEKELTEYIPDLINTLLSRPNLDNIKSVCLVLKLCGPNLEKYFSEKRQSNFSDIMKKLKDICEDSKTETRIVDVITNVLEMWGRGWKAPPPPAGFFNPYLPENMTSEQLAAATPATFEEQQQNQNGYYQPEIGYSNGYNNDCYGSYDFGPCGDEQDSDVVDAFEQFLAASGQK